MIQNAHCALPCGPQCIRQHQTTSDNYCIQAVPDASGLFQRLLITVMCEVSFARSQACCYLPFVQMVIYGYCGRSMDTSVGWHLCARKARRLISFMFTDQAEVYVVYSGYQVHAAYLSFISQAPRKPCKVPSPHALRDCHIHRRLMAMCHLALEPMQPPQLPWMYGILPQVHRLPYLVQGILQNILQKQSQVQEAIWALHWYLLASWHAFSGLVFLKSMCCKTFVSQ